MAQTQLVRISAPGSGKPPLSKAQKEFNRLTKKIEELEHELTQFRKAMTSIQQRIYGEYEPLLRSYNDLRAQLVRLFDRAHDQPGTTKTEKKKLAALILDLAYNLISEHEMEELKPIFDKYDAKGFDASEAEADQDVSEVMKQMVSSLYGIEFDEKVDVSTKEKFMAYVDEQMKARQPPPADQKTGPRGAKKPKTAKQQAREAKKQAEERNITKAVRTLYMDLVKTFHPDREPDEAEKTRKTEIMQRVTEAYENSDLLTLLRLQLEFNRIDQQHLETLADEQLTYYNKILKQQATELGDELRGIQYQLASALGQPPMLAGSVAVLEMNFNSDLRALKKSVKDLRRELKELADPAILKAFLKAQKR